MRRIFLSYGHDEHAELARRLKRDLEARGHEVWFDEERLLPGEDWEACIERGIDWVCGEPEAGRVILLMTPHAVRRPDGYCLNEIAHALRRGLRVVPVMVVWCEPPLSICRIQWLDVRDCVPIASHAAAYEGKLERLASSVETDAGEFEGIQSRLLALLDPLPFDAEISEHLSRFTGRKWIFDSIDAWLADRDAERVFWITGPPGVGKTALAARLLSTRREIVAVHLCRFGHAQKADPRRCIMSIAYQLATQVPEYQQRLNALNLTDLTAQADARTLFDRLIVQPLSANLADPGRTLVVLIDALDEATQDGRNQLAAFLATEFARTPPWLRLIITSRPDPEVMYPLQAITAHVIDAASAGNVADLRTFLLRELRAHLPDVRNADAVVETIIERSEGSFLYAEWLRKEIISGRMALSEADRFPKGLGGVYAQFVERQWPDIQKFKERVAPALDALAAAREPLPATLLAELFGWSERQLNDFGLSLGSLFELTNNRIAPFHKSLLDWLTDRGKAGQYFVSAADGQARLADLCWRTFERGPTTMPDYERRSLCAHLLADERWEALEAALTNLAFLETRVAAGEIFALASDFAAAIAALPTDRLQQRVLRLVEEAFRRDLHFIARHPTTLFQCLWNACWWYDSPEAARHLSDPEGGWGGHQPPWLQAGPKLYELLERWRKEKAARMPGFSWLRSMRPPALPLGNNHMVLGGHTDSIHTVSLSADGTRLISGSRDGTIRVWETASGQELLVVKTDAPVYSAAISPDGRRIAAAPATRKKVTVWDAATGRQQVAVEHSAKEIHCVAFHPNGRILAAGSDDATVLVWDIEAGQELAVLRSGRNRVESVAFSPDGTVLLTGGGWGAGEPQYVREWDWRAGRERSCVAAHNSLLHDLVFSPDGGKFATCCGDARGEYSIKIWDRESGASVTLSGHTNSVESIGFSPDDRQLVSGSWDETIRLWDVATGVQLRSVNPGNKVNCVGFLPDGRRIYSAGYDNNVRIWDGLDAAAPAPQRPDFRQNIWSMEFSPNGALLASGSEGGRLQLADGFTGRMLGDMQGGMEGPIAAITFSPDACFLVASAGYAPWEDLPHQSGEDNFIVSLFKVGAPEYPVQLSGLTAKTRNIGFAADGRSVFARSNGQMLTWPAADIKWPSSPAGEEMAEPLAREAACASQAAKRFEARMKEPETVVVDLATGQEVGWFTEPLDALIAHPGGCIWAGRSDRIHPHTSDARRLEMICVEEG